MEHIKKALEKFPKSTQSQANTGDEQPSWWPSEVEIEENKARKEKYGYAPDLYCVRCHGAGLLHPTGVDSRVIWGRTIPCICLKESVEDHRKDFEFSRKRGVGKRKKTFEGFKVVEGTKAAFDGFYNLAHGETEKPFLLVYGGVGNGKTHLAEAAVLVLNARGIDARIFTVSDVVAKIKGAIANETVEDEVRKLKEYPALLLDDYGVNYGSDWEMSKLEDIVDARFREERITAMTTNKDVAELPERLDSRFSDGSLSVLALNKGKDRRKSK